MSAALPPMALVHLRALKDLTAPSAQTYVQNLGLATQTSHKLEGQPVANHFHVIRKLLAALPLAGTLATGRFPLGGSCSLA